MSKVKIQGNASGTGIFTVAAPATNTDRTITLPDVDATILTNVSSLAASQLTGTLSNARLPSGTILQAKSTQWNTYTNITTYSPVDLFSVAITPISSSNKILVMIKVTLGQTNDWGLYLKRTISGSSSYIGNHGRDTAYSEPTTWIASDENTYGQYVALTVGMDYIDSPSTTSEITYTVGHDAKGGNSVNTFLNGSQAPNTGGVSSITVMEIVG
jgi:hypothetical protein